MRARHLPVRPITTRALVSLAAVCLATAATSEPTPVTVFEAGTSGYAIFRIPALVRAADGDLLAFSEARQGGDAGETDIVMRRSTDLGRSWGDLRVVQESEDFRSLFGGGEAPPITVGNPAPVVDTLDPDRAGRVWLPFTLENDRVFVTFSDDHGETWSQPREITASVKRPDWGWYATGPGHSIQILRGPHRGRLIVPSDHRIGDGGVDRGSKGAHVVLSDDHGRTWRLGAVDDTYDDGLDANETTAVELRDGSLYFNTRDQNGAAPGTRGEAWSRDGGETFSPAHPGWRAFRPAAAALDPPVVQCSLLRLCDEMILFSGPDEDGPTGRGRSDLRIRRSTDEARSWRDGALLHAGPAAYSDMVAFGDCRGGILFEAGDPGQPDPYQRIVFLEIGRAESVEE